MTTTAAPVQTTVFLACFLGQPEAVFLSEPAAQAYLAKRYVYFHELTSVHERQVEA